MIWGVRIHLFILILLSLIAIPGAPLGQHIIPFVAVPWLAFEIWRFGWYPTLWLIDCGNRWIIQSRFRSNEYDDDDVLMTSFSFRFVQPQIESETYHRRTYHLWLRQRKITMVSLVRQSAAHDPLLPFITRIEAIQLQKAQAELESGGEIAGADRWSLTDTTLTVKDRATGERVYPISELVSAKCCVDHVAVWSHEDVMPVLNVPISSPNAPLLLVLLDDNLARQTLPEQKEYFSENSLGRRIFTSRRGQKIGIHLVIIALIVWFGFVRRANPDFIMVLGFFSIFYAIIGLLPAMARLLSPRFEIYENGVVRLGWLGKTTIPFEKMLLGYAFAKNVMYNYHVLCMLKVELLIQWQDEVGRIRHTTWQCRGRNLSHEFAEYDFFSEELTEVVVRKMRDELHASGRVHWNDAIQIAADGLHLTAPQDKAKKLGTVVVPFDQLRSKLDENGVTFGADEIWIFVPKDALNFFPGIRFIHEVAARSKGL